MPAKGFFITDARHCEEPNRQSDLVDPRDGPARDCFVSLAMTTVGDSESYSAACDWSRTDLAISLPRSNSARRRAISSGDKRTTFE